MPLSTSAYRQLCEIIVHLNSKLEFEILKKRFQAQKSESEHKNNWIFNPKIYIFVKIESFNSEQ